MSGSWGQMVVGRVIRLAPVLLGAVQFGHSCPDGHGDPREYDVFREKTISLGLFSGYCVDVRQVCPSHVYPRGTQAC